MARGFESPKRNQPDAAEENEPTSGGSPDGLGMCVDCKGIYPVQKTERDGLRPIGVDGSCECGNADFLPCTDI